MARYEFSNTQDGELAAIGDGAQAFFNLGMMYSTGRTVQTNMVTAHKWFNLAAMQGNREARDYRIEVAQELSREEIAEAQRQAREWLDAN
jgi:TPR repeat protein